MKKLGRKQVIVGMLSAAMVLGSAMPALAAQGWNQNQTGWWYENSDGSYATSGWREINGTWYYFNAAGYMATGWVQDGGRWFFNDASGAMLTGWINVGGEYYYLNPVSDGSRGAMAVGEVVIDGAAYYFNESGACTNTFALSDSIPRYYTDGVRYDKANHPSGGGSGSGSSGGNNTDVSASVKDTNQKVMDNMEKALANAGDIINSEDPEAPIKDVKLPSTTNTNNPIVTVVLNEKKKAETHISDVSEVLLETAKSVIDENTIATVTYGGHTYKEDEMDDALRLLETASQSDKTLDQLKSSYTVKVTLKTKETVTYTFNIR